MDTKTILVVEDELGPRESLKMILGSKYHVEVAENGIKAFEMLSKKNIDGITMDLRMPGPSGIEVLKQIKAKFPSIEVLVITGYGTLRTALDAMRYGAYNYILKPFNIDEIVGTMERMLLKKKKMDQMDFYVHENKMVTERDEVYASSLSLV